MIRICHLQLLPILSGVQRSMIETLLLLDPARYEVHVACQGPGPMTEELTRLGIQVHFVPDMVRPVHPWRDYHAYCHLRELFTQYRFDIVHSHSSKPGVLGRLAARHAGVPHVVHHVHAFAFHDYSPRSRRWIYEHIERRAAAYCDRMLFVNREERDLVIDRGWLPAEHCQTIYNGVDLDAVHPRRAAEFRQPCRAEWGVRDDEVVIVFLGRLEYPKQPLILADIARQLESLAPASPWRLLIVGSGAQEAELATCLRQQGLEHRVKRLGWQSQPHRVLYGADVMLLTSLAEGLPRCLIEAQAAALPAVVSDAKGNREVVTPGTGFLCPPQDARAYAESLARLIDSPALRRSQGLAARRHAEACFDTVANNGQIVALYESLLAA